MRKIPRMATKKLDELLKMTGVTYSQIARDMRYSRQQLLRVRCAESGVTARFAEALLRALRRRLKRQIRPDEVFEEEAIARLANRRGAAKYR
jgi:transcriptional regulator with XRE-family HTH domain